MNYLKYIINLSVDYSQIIIGLFSGGMFIAIIRHFLDKKREIQLNLNQINEGKYRTLLIHMSCALDFNNRKFFSIKKDFEDDNKGYYLNCVKEYYYQSLLYSPDFVIEALKKFVVCPTKENFIKTAKAMRKDLWGKETKLEINDLLLNKK